MFRVNDTVWLESEIQECDQKAADALQLPGDVLNALICK
jgi:hypothetical protein